MVDRQTRSGKLVWSKLSLTIEVISVLSPYDTTEEYYTTKAMLLRSGRS